MTILGCLRNKSWSLVSKTLNAEHDTPDRLPSPSDRGKLPGIDRIFHETVRQVQLCDLVFANCSLIEMLQDGTLSLFLEFPTSRCLQNMFIPKGYGQEGLFTTLAIRNPILTVDGMNVNRSLVMANAYAITHNPAIYNHPDKFNLDRYLPISEGGSSEPLPVGHFGFGRR